MITPLLSSNFTSENVALQQNTNISRQNVVYCELLPVVVLSTMSMVF
jgi:hypothetical protein